MMFIFGLLFGFFLGLLFFTWYIGAKLETHEAYRDDSGGLAWRERDGELQLSDQPSEWEYRARSFSNKLKTHEPYIDQQGRLVWRERE